MMFAFVPSQFASATNRKFLNSVELFRVVPDGLKKSAISVVPAPRTPFDS